MPPWKRVSCILEIRPPAITAKFKLSYSTKVNQDASLTVISNVYFPEDDFEGLLSEVFRNDISAAISRGILFRYIEDDSPG